MPLIIVRCHASHTVHRKCCQGLRQLSAAPRDCIERTRGSKVTREWTLWTRRGQAWTCHSSAASGNTLETRTGNIPTTRNARLPAIQFLFAYAALRLPKHAGL